MKRKTIQRYFQHKHIDAGRKSDECVPKDSSPPTLTLGDGFCGRFSPEKLAETSRTTKHLTTLSLLPHRVINVCSFSAENTQSHNLQKVLKPQSSCFCNYLFVHYR